MKIKNVLSTFVFSLFVTTSTSSFAEDVKVGQLWQKLRTIDGCRVRATLNKDLDTKEVTGQKTVTVKNCGGITAEDLINDFKKDDSLYMDLGFVGNENWRTEEEQEDNSSAPPPSIH